MLQHHSNNSACSLWYHSAVCLNMNCILKCNCRANAAKMTKSTADSGQENDCVENLIWLIAFRWAITNFTKTMFDIYHTRPVDDISVNIKLIRHTGKTQNSIFKILFQSCLVNDVSQISAWGETDRDAFNHRSSCKSCCCCSNDAQLFTSDETVDFKLKVPGSGAPDWLNYTI